MAETSATPSPPVTKEIKKGDVAFKDGTVLKNICECTHSHIFLEPYLNSDL